MLRVVGCITQEHDLGLVALACLVCLLATNTSLRLLGSHQDGYQQQRVTRTGAAIMAFSTGVWATHFISMLAFRPGVPVGFDVPLCILSFVISIAATAVAFTIRQRQPGNLASIIASGLSSPPGSVQCILSACAPCGCRG